MKILVVDDEALARERVVSLLRELESHAKIMQASNGLETLQSCTEFKPDLVLLDVRMPGMDGLETAHYLSQTECPPAIIFVTAYGDHALQAFESQAIDYLLKPIRKERLQQGLQRAQVFSQGRLAALPKPQIRQFIRAEAKGGVRLLAVEEICYFRADQKYVEAGSRHGVALLEESLKSLESEFGDRFLRIHRNALVSRRHVRALEKDASGWCILLAGCEVRFGVSRRHLRQVRKQIG